MLQNSNDVHTFPKLSVSWITQYTEQYYTVCYILLCSQISFLAFQWL
jgi:hypothetical protein